MDKALEARLQALEGLVASILAATLTAAELDRAEASAASMADLQYRHRLRVISQAQVIKGDVER